jgi:hypothetical protein
VQKTLDQRSKGEDTKTSAQVRIVVEGIRDDIAKLLEKLDILHCGAFKGVL